MSTSIIATDRWKSILIQKRQSFSLLGSNALALVTNQESFRTHFENVCWRLNEPRTQTLLGGIDCSFYHIDPFIQVINAATLNYNSSGYVNLIWGACFAVIECVSGEGSAQRQIGHKLNDRDGPVQLIAELNKSIPNFESDVKYAGEPSVQEALQDIFETYIDCCLSIITTLLTERNFPTSIVNNSEAKSPRECVTNARIEMLNIKEKKFDMAVSLLSVQGPSRNSLPRRRYAESRRSMPGEFPTNLRQEIAGVYEIVKTLGYGASGHVDEVTRLSDGKSFARKHIERPYDVPWAKFRSGVLEEINITRKLHFVHVVTVDSWTEASERAMEIYMTPVADGNLDRILRDCAANSYKEETTRQIYSWFGCLLRTLAYVHSQSVLHKDIKPHNVLVKGANIYLADFGLSRDFVGASSQTMSSFSGTAEYQAPEFANGASHGRASDIFSLGCVFSEMLTVLCRKDLDEFKKLRRAPVPIGFRSVFHNIWETTSRAKYTFYQNLGKVTDWVRSLGGDPTNDLLVSIILKMLHYYADDRVTATGALEMLESNDELRCKCSC